MTRADAAASSPRGKKKASASGRTRFVPNWYCDVSEHDNLI